MKAETIKHLVENIDEVYLKGRVFLNNPVVYHTLGIAPLVVVDTSASNAGMLFTAVLFLLAPVRILSFLLTRRAKNWLRPFITIAVAALWYIPVYFILSSIFQEGLLSMGIYLPMLVCEPLILQRFEHEQETELRDVALKAVGFTIGYGLMLLVLGLLREFLGGGTLFGAPVMKNPLFPIAGLTSGGFILLGILVALWRESVNRFKKYVNLEVKRFHG